MSDQQVLLKDQDSPLYQQICEHFCNEVRSKKLEYGDALPSVVSVARKFGVNYRTVRQAYETLEDIGIVRLDSGKARVVKPAVDGSKSTKIKHISVVSFNPEITANIDHNFYAREVFFSISAKAGRLGYNVQNISMCDDDALQNLIKSEPEGIVFIVTSTAHIDVIPLNKLKGIPKVFLEPLVPGEVCVNSDGVQGMSLAMEHLRELGHERIAILMGSLRDVSAQNRLEAYCKCMQKYGLQIQPNWITSFPGYFLDDPEEQVKVYKKLFVEGPKPTAVVCTQHFGAMGLLNQLHRECVKVPDEVSIVAYDDTPSASFTLPSLTVVKQPIEEIGRTAVECLQKMIDKEDIKSISLPFELIVRESTSKAPVV